MTVGINIRIRSRFLPAFLCAILAGCELVGNETEAELKCLSQPVSGVLQPLEIGNRWEYERVGSDSPNLVHEVTGKLDRKDESGNELFVLSRYSKDGTSSRTTRIVTNTNEGFEYAGRIFEQDTLIVTSVTFRHPTSVGHTYPAFSARRDSDDGSIVLTNYTEFEVLAVDHSTSVPMGEFETTVYVEKRYSTSGLDFPTGPFLHSFAPGVGYVARDHGTSSEGLEVKAPHLQLVDYCLMQ